MRLSLVTLNARYSHSCPALFHLRQALAAALPQSRITIQQFTINDPYYDTLLAITETEPEALCFSVSVWNVTQTLRLMADLRLVLPEIPMVVGGPEAASLGKGQLPPGCTVVQGEVEGLSPEFYADLAAGQLAPEYRAAAGPAFGMPYRDEDFSTRLANRNIYYESSRGCPFACAYCLSSVERGMRLVELATVYADLAKILAHRPRVVRFVDRTFNADPGRCLAIWQWLLAQSGETLFHFEIAPDLFSETMLDFLATVPPGRFQFEIGLQSTTPPVLAAVNRRMDLDRASANISRLARLNTIHLHLDLILGLPMETEESFLASLDHAFALAPHYLQMGLLKVLPDTPLAARTQEFGLVHSTLPPYSVLATGWLDHPTLRRLHRLGECVEAFHNNRFFRGLFGYLRRKGVAGSAFFAQLLAVCEAEGFFGLAATQELMARMLVRLGEALPDQQLFGELLRFDWLASGQRQFPAFLGDNEALRQARDQLWQALPESWPPYFDHAGRKEFCKRGVFFPFSAELLAVAGLGDGSRPGQVCFLPERDGGVMGRQRMAVFFQGE
ncbi:MAG: DUF4080 domain-containing protein [Thermodesulfobacteriota bacterium]